jgi:hypothetical protein
MSEQTMGNQDCAPFQKGMSLRAWLAGQALQGACASMVDDATWPAEAMAIFCVKRADALLAELEKE